MFNNYFIMTITTHKEFLTTVKNGINYSKNIFFEDSTLTTQSNLIGGRNYIKIIDKLNFDVIVRDFCIISLLDSNNLYFDPYYTTGFYPSTIKIFYKNNNIKKLDFDFKHFKEIYKIKDVVEKVVIRFSSEYNIDGYTNSIDFHRNL